MRAKFVSLEWIPSKALFPAKSNSQMVIPNFLKSRRRYCKPKLILVVEDLAGKKYELDIYSHVKYVKHNIRITKHVRKNLQDGFEKYPFEVFKEEIIGVYDAIRKAVRY